MSVSSEENNKPNKPRKTAKIMQQKYGKLKKGQQRSLFREAPKAACQSHYCLAGEAVAVLLSADGVKPRELAAFSSVSADLIGFG